MSSSPTPSAEARVKGERNMDEAQEKRAERDAENTDEWRPAEGPGALFDPKIAHLRKIYTRILLGTLALTIVMMWICVSVYWGSLARSATHAPSLKTWVIDKDGGEVGQAVVQGLLATTQSGTKQHLGWRQIPADQVDDVAYAIVDEQAWGAVVVNPGATTRLAAARASGDRAASVRLALTVTGFGGPLPVSRHVFMEFSTADDNLARSENNI
ncbi:hypothetical protein FRC09_010034, partial [Ceratobasidium sp. 395]